MKTCPNCQRQHDESVESCTCGHTFDSTNLLNPGTGQVGINNEGEVTIGLGSGLSIDAEGDLNIMGVEIG